MSVLSGLRESELGDRQVAGFAGRDVCSSTKEKPFLEGALSTTTQGETIIWFCAKHRDEVTCHKRGDRIRSSHGGEGRGARTQQATEATGKQKVT